MPAHEANPIYLSEGERRDLEALIRQKTCAQHVLAGVARIACARNCGTCAPPGSTRSPAVSVTRRCPCRRRAQCAAAEQVTLGEGCGLPLGGTFFLFEAVLERSDFRG